MSFEGENVLHPIILMAAAAAAPQQAAADAARPDEEIVVTGSREPVPLDEAAISATVIAREYLEALGVPASSDVLRLIPGVSVSVSGPRGTQTQVRIRGAEANHTLVFVDGIRFNDPAAGNEARFELLGTDALSRLEVVRGPQSALWGSEALGGVVALETADPFRDSGFSALAEYGSLDTARASAQFATRTGGLGLSGSGGLFRTDGIDAFGTGGERDGFDHRFGSLKAVISPLPSAELGLVGHYVEGESEFDGFDPATFRRGNTLHSTDNRVFAIRSWAATRLNNWSLVIDGSYLDSENRNRLAGDPLNDTFGNRFTLGGQLSGSVGNHRLTGAVEYEGEDFRARDRSFRGRTNQNRSRELTAFVGQWRAKWSPQFLTDLAVRHDSFSAFADATTFRGTALFKPVEAWTLHAAYGEGIAQPTFFDLFGFFPGSFVGNPSVRPESSRGWEAGLRWRSESASAGITGFSNRLRDEIVSTFNRTTFLSSTANADGKSRRQGIELDAQYRLSAVNLAVNYTYLDAEEQQVPGTDLVREVRRPRHSANLLADGSAGPLEVGASLAYVGKRRDLDFDVFPARAVTLDDYVLAALKVGWRISPAVEGYVRAENLFDAEYEDVLGFNTPGRTIHAGLRLRMR